jgi:hypothetical protein
MLNNSLNVIATILLATCIYAAPIDDYQEGKKLAEKLQKTIRQPNAGKVPSYTREPEKQATWQSNTRLQEKDLNSAATRELNTEQVAQTVTNTNNQRPRIQKLNESSLIKNGMFLENHAAEILAVQGKAFTQTHSNVTRITCEASRDPEKFKCIRYLKIPKIQVIPARTENHTQHLGCLHHRNQDWWRKQADILVEGEWRRVRITYPGGNLCYAHWTTNHPKQVIETENPIWVSDCVHLEARVRLNECKLIKSECLDKQPKTIDGETITKPCWKYQDTYRCQYPCLNNCTSYLQQGCKHVSSECKFKVQDKCYIWRQHLECPGQTNQVVTEVENAKWFGINGECGGVPFEPNNEFASSLAELSIFGQMQKEAQGGLNNLFKGQNNQCRKTGFGLKDCCEKMGGWGVNFRLTGCNEEEKLLAEKRERGLCHEIGIYKVGKEALVIPKRKTSFCCFPSKLARVLHEQGRGQVGLQWGDPESPNCRGFTVEEISRLNFESMNLSELFADIMQKVKPLDPNKLNSQIQDKFKLIERGTVNQEDRKDA